MEAITRALSRRDVLGGVAGIVAGAAAGAVGDAIAQTPRLRRFQTVIDLTHVMSPEFPTILGVPGIEMQKQFDFKKNGFNLYWWRIIEHAGTHMDAPIHFTESGATAEKLTAEALVVPLAVVNVAAQAAQNADYLLSRQDLVDWEERHGRLPDNCCVAMDSGWAQHVTNPAKFTGKDVAGALHFPGIGPEAAEWLLTERRAAGLAVETMSLDHGPSKDFKTHYLWLSAGRWGIEGIANLGKVPAVGATLVAGLAKVRGII